MEITMDNMYGFFVGLAIVLGVLLLFKIVFKLKIKLGTIIKVGINATLGFFIIVVFNLFAGIFSAAFVATWWEWLIIGISGIFGAIICIVFSFVWPNIW